MIWLSYGMSAAFCGLWVYALVYLHRSVASMPPLPADTELAPPEDGDWPLVSVIVPACNEAAQIETALASLLSQDYPRLEVIAVDDRSTDETGRIIDRIAASDPRVQPAHVESLPAGWLGKVNALNEGVQRAGGEWYLFTDADVHFRPSVVRRAICYAVGNEVDHLTCLPEIDGQSSFWLDVHVRAFFLLLCASGRIAEVNRDGSRHAIGIGAFNLVRAAAFERTPGFEWLRMEPADDLGLGLMLKQAGARTRLLDAEREIRVPWYDSVGAMVRGFEKNSFGAGAGYSYLRQLLLVSLLGLLVAMPSVSLLTGLYCSDWTLAAFGGTAHVATLIAAFTLPRRAPRDIAANLLLPIGVAGVALISLRAAFKCLHNGGIDWRGTHYAIAELRRGQRFRL